VVYQNTSIFYIQFFFFDDVVLEQMQNDRAYNQKSCLCSCLISFDVRDRRRPWIIMYVHIGQNSKPVSEPLQPAAPTSNLSSK
jgi:hypothetical protein